MTRWLVAALLAVTVIGAQAGVLRTCDAPPRSSPAEQDRLLQLAAVIRARLAQSPAAAALVARTGTDLSRLGLRYSHAGIALREGLGSPWAVRQLFYACEASEGRLFDQGLAGFVLGADDVQTAFVSVLLLPPEAGEPLARATLDRDLALQLLESRYSANAYAFSTRYQNCNQWVAELLAASLSGTRDRSAAQAWLREAGYAPEPVRVDSAWVWLAGHFVPHLHFDDHPSEAVAQRLIQTSLPDRLEAFVLARWPQAQRLEFCLGPEGVVTREGGAPLGAECRAAPGDQLTPGS
ncbi:DUF2145 domain-containing protein [Roseateles sp.]|uniref:DUF2145 domain-containing protein n=1 Tax=Roseateles sp. TaxID=1971397 RepID=UPI003934C882